MAASALLHLLLPTPPRSKLREPPGPPARARARGAAAPAGVKALVSQQAARGRLVGGAAHAAGARARRLAALQQALQVALHHGVAMVVLQGARAGAGGRDGEGAAPHGPQGGEAAAEAAGADAGPSSGAAEQRRQIAP